MSQEVTVLAANVRERKSKGTTRELRRQSQIPAVIYGNNQAPIMISIEEKLLTRYAHKQSFLTHLFDLDIDGKKHRVLPRDVQFDPVSDRPIHADFMRVSAKTLVRVGVPVVFTNPEKSPGIKRGGTLNVVHHEIEVICSPEHIPEKFEISLDGLQINDAVHLSAIKLQGDVRFAVNEKDYTIATIAVPSGVRTEAADAAASTATGAAPAAAPAAGAKAPAAAPAAGAKAPAADSKAAAPKKK